MDLNSVHSLPGSDIAKADCFHVLKGDGTFIMQPRLECISLQTCFVVVIYLEMLEMNVCTLLINNLLLLVTLLV